MTAVEKRRLATAQAASLPKSMSTLAEAEARLEELSDGLRAIQSTDTPGTEDLHALLQDQYAEARMRVAALRMTLEKP